MSPIVGATSLVALPWGLFLALVLRYAALEVKDCQWDRLNAPYGLDFRNWIWRNFDKVDFALTIVGGLVGSLVRWHVIGRFM